MPTRREVDRLLAGVVAVVVFASNQSVVTAECAAMQEPGYPTLGKPSSAQECDGERDAAHEKEPGIARRYDIAEQLQQEAKGN